MVYILSNVPYSKLQWMHVKLYDFSILTHHLHKENEILTAKQAATHPRKSSMSIALALFLSYSFFVKISWIFCLASKLSSTN